MRRYGYGLLILAVVIGLGRNAQAQSAASSGLKAQITAVAIPATRRPVVTFSVRDSGGKPLELADLDAESVKFTIAALKTDKSGARDYSNYILTKVAGKNFSFKGESHKPALAETAQPDVDRGGTLARVRSGVFSYTFKTALPANYDTRATHVVGGGMTRASPLYAANPLFE